MTGILKRAAGVNPEPYPHVCISQAIDPGTYDHLAAHRPTVDQILQGRAPGANLRFDLNARAALALIEAGEWDAGFWEAFIRHHTSTKFWHEILDLFEPAIRDLHASALTTITDGGSLYDLSVGIRPDPSADVQLDVGIGINTPCEYFDTVRGPHIDNPVELFAAMLYMRADDDDSFGGDLVIDDLIVPTADMKFHGKAELAPEQARRGSVVPYVKNQAVAFINSLTSIHEVTPRSITPHPRLLVNIIAEFTSPLFRYRHLK